MLTISLDVLFHHATFHLESMNDPASSLVNNVFLFIFIHKLSIGVCSVLSFLLSLLLDSPKVHVRTHMFTGSVK